ncbi:MAG TPA: hypothetical protein ENI89_13130, partial [Desulfobulbus sp.]|nr:hypothetical protein [Desulfobulbus sp.]
MARVPHRVRNSTFFHGATSGAVTDQGCTGAEPFYYTRPRGSCRRNKNKVMLLTYPPELPISACRAQIVEALRTSRVLVVAGDTGSGKTTQLPKMCLEAGRGRHGLIGCTQPRRIAAVAMAERVAEELREPAAVSYRIRFSDQTTDTTRIKFMTDGILLAESRGDRLLLAYDTLIIDEAHERSLNIDFLLGHIKGLLARRKDLNLV